jgi:hypothetical protein
MKAADLLPLLDIGNSVAEFDTHLQAYFLETQIYSDFVNGRCDIVTGDKGTGKTAIYRIIRDKYRDIPELQDVELVAGFNDSGNPVFQRLSQAQVLSEGQYITVWKTYILAILGNYVLDICEGAYSNQMKELDRLLTALGVRTHDATASTVFSQLANLLRSITHPKAAEIAFSVTDAGMPIVAPRVEFAELSPQEHGIQKIVNSDDALRLLNQTIEDLGINMWLVLDRLDEAFVGMPDIEIPALRALFRTYLDMQAYDRAKLKLFVRNDLFRKVTRGGFVNLTHVNARRVEITWHPEDLHALLCRRVRECPQFMQALSLSQQTEDAAIFSALFPEQVDIGEKKPTTWNWILSRIRDGNGVAPPRNLIDLVNKAKEAQSRREGRAPRDIATGAALLEADSIHKALVALSEQRVQDTLLAESGQYATHINAFQAGKAEHTGATVARTLGLAGVPLEDVINELVALGFLERIGASYKIPMLYRSGLKITQGKAFSQDPVGGPSAKLEELQAGDAGPGSVPTP